VLGIAVSALPGCANEVDKPLEQAQRFQAEAEQLAREAVPPGFTVASIDGPWFYDPGGHDLSMIFSRAPSWSQSVYVTATSDEVPGFVVYMPFHFDGSSPYADKPPTEAEQGVVFMWIEGFNSMDPARQRSFMEWWSRLAGGRELFNLTRVPGKDLVNAQEGDVYEFAWRDLSDDSEYSSAVAVWDAQLQSWFGMSYQEFHR
jgi:hypothetical protein